MILEDKERIELAIRRLEDSKQPHADLVIKALQADLKRHTQRIVIAESYLKEDEILATLPRVKRAPKPY